MVTSARRHLESLIEKYGISYKSLEWNSTESQFKRFEILCEVADLNGKSVLDVGCGFAHLFDYLVDNEICAEYSGMDIVPKMIELAQSRWGHLDLFCGDIRAMDTLRKKYDYVLASGILTKMESVANVTKSIRNMFSLCRRGVAFNTVSIYSFTLRNYEEKTGLGDIFYHYVDQLWANPSELFDFCMTITPHVVLRHDYRHNDLTIYMYRRQQQ